LKGEKSRGLITPESPLDLNLMLMGKKEKKKEGVWISRAKKSKEVQKLIVLGKEKGYLTYDELNNVLPSDIIASDAIDEVLITFSEMDIQVVEAASKLTVKQEEPEEEPAAAEAEPEPKETESLLGKTNDPIRMYLREMGTVSLLTREGEVEIAKRIEKGEQDVMESIMNCPITIKEVINIGSRLTRNHIKIRDITKDIDDEDGCLEEEEEFYAQKVTKIIEEIKCLDEQCEQLVLKVKRKDLAKSTLKRAKTKHEKNTVEIKEKLLFSFLFYP